MLATAHSTWNRPPNANDCSAVSCPHHWNHWRHSRDAALYHFPLQNRLMIVKRRNWIVADPYDRLTINMKVSKWTETIWSPGVVHHEMDGSKNITGNERTRRDTTPKKHARKEGEKREIRTHVAANGLGSNGFSGPPTAMTLDSPHFSEF